MRKILYFVLTLLMSSVNLPAQVSIGSEDGPRAGAGLDLNSNNKGLLLPNVSLSDPGTAFQLNGGDPSQAKGMLVYNTSNNLDGPGIYVWDGSKWILNTCIPATPGTITLSITIANLNSTFTASVPAVTTGAQIPEDYIWTLPDGLTGSSSSRTITITGAKTGTYAAGTIKVTAKNACGTSVEQTSASDVNVVNCPGYLCTDCAYDYSSTYGSMSGDIAKGQTPSSTSNDEDWAPNVRIGIGTIEYTEYDSDLFDAFIAANQNLCVYKKNSNTSSRTDWVDAVQACNGTHDGYSDWYLPNLRELRALYDALVGTVSGYFIGNGYFGSDGSGLIRDVYWSSTEDTYHTAHTIEFYSGDRDNPFKPYLLYVRCVRRM
jgi:hypothetical protein